MSGERNRGVEREASGRDEAPHPTHRHEVERWPAGIALVAIGVIYLFVSGELRVGPRWLLLAVEGCLLLILLLARALERRRISHWLGRVMTGLATLAIALSALFLITRLPGSKIAGAELLGSSALVYLSNVVVFALWYWEIDGGGPLVRRLGHYSSRDFVFPQFQQDPQGAALSWMPGAIDYLFLAFNTSTAFSPTDTLVLSSRAKLLMMAQSLISLVVVAVLAARAINIL